MWQAAHWFITEQKYADAALQLLYWLDLVAPIVLILLLLMACYLWCNNKGFYLELTDTHLTMQDPLFGEYQWQLALQQIVEIKHYFQVHTGFTEIKVLTLDGKQYQLTKNYAYDRKKLYAQIQAVAPHIKLPAHPYKFPQSH
ncbi:hypothetical protein [Paraglaciecola aestuariivivens]